MFIWLVIVLSLHCISLRFPQFCLWKSSQGHLMDDCPFSSFEGSPSGSSSVPLSSRWSLVWSRRDRVRVGDRQKWKGYRLNNEHKNCRLFSSLNGANSAWKHRIWAMKSLFCSLMPDFFWECECWQSVSVNAGRIWEDFWLFLAIIVSGLRITNTLAALGLNLGKSWVLGDRCTT